MDALDSRHIQTCTHTLISALEIIISQISRCNLKTNPHTTTHIMYCTNPDSHVWEELFKGGYCYFCDPHMQVNKHLAGTLIGVDIGREVNSVH